MSRQRKHAARNYLYRENGDRLQALCAGCGTRVAIVDKVWTEGWSAIQFPASQFRNLGKNADEYGFVEWDDSEPAHRCQSCKKPFPSFAKIAVAFNAAKVRGQTRFTLPA